MPRASHFGRFKALPLGLAQPGPLAHWTFDAADLDLPDVFDASGNGHHGAAVGNVAAAAGQIGGALDFPGDGDYVQVAHHADLSLTGGAFTLSAWIFPETWGQNDQGRILSKGSANPGSGGPGWTLSLDNATGAGSPATFFVDVNSYDLVGRMRAPNDSLALGVWQHVAARLDDGVLQFFLGGSPVGSPYTGVPAPGAETGDLFMGIRSTDLLREFDGLIDDARIYDTALTDQQIADLVAP